MKITQWLGFNEESSQYLLRKGELRALVNLQPRRAGMLTSRQGVIKIHGKFDDETIYGLYRRDTLVGADSDFLCFQKVVIEKTLTIDEINAKLIPEQVVWVVRRLQGNQERVIAQLPISPTGKSDIRNFCICEDRRGRLFLFYGHGAAPQMYRPGSIANNTIDMGLDAPKTAPSIDPTGEGYFLESCDVLTGGGSYWGPPTIRLVGGDPDRAAKVKGIIKAGNLVGIDVIDGGAGYKSFPKIVVGGEKVGFGFRGVGYLENDPGVQGFVDTAAGVITGTAPTATETFGLNNSLTGNKIMYLGSTVSASTRTAAQPAAATTQMIVVSVQGIGVGDTITIYSGVVPAAFASGAVIRVLAIDEATRTLTLSKSWTPAANTSYFVQARKDTEVSYADATWDATNKRFTAALPLKTLRGAGEGAEATLQFSPAAYSFGLGTFKMNGYTTPTGGVEAAEFAFKSVGWNNYINGDYWQGSFQNATGSEQNRTYAGIQASGRRFAYGYSGTVSTQNRGQTINQRADVYWPDYSSISVWLCTGAFSDDVGQWSRYDATVYDGDTSSPYAVVTLRPTVNARISSKSGKRSYRAINKPYGTSPLYRPPKIRINLKPCPDSWVTTVNVNGANNLPFGVKEARKDRMQWWHSSRITPRPIVDVRGSADRLDWGTVEVIDPGAGWERSTLFALRIYQANPYDQITDYNTAVREPKIAGYHSPFNPSSRYAQFVFRATAADDLTPAGPPNALAESQYVDVGGAGYRNGDTASVTLLKRSMLSATEAGSGSFDGIMIAGGTTTEFTYTAGVQNPGAVLAWLSGGLAYSAINVGDVISCTSAGVLLDSSRVIRKVGNQLYLDKMRGISVDGTATMAGTVIQDYITVTGVAQYQTVGTKLWDNVSGQICTIASVATFAGNTVLTVTGPVTDGSRVFYPVFTFSATAGIKQSQVITWTAETIAAGTGEQRVTSIRIVSGGRNYFSPPTVMVRGGGNGYGLAVTPTVEGGKITSLLITDPGRAYTAQPELYTEGSAATAVPVMRPTMRGVYRCAYRFADLTDTIVLNTNITAVQGDSATTLTLASVEGVEPGMILESDILPHGTRVVSVNGNVVEVSQEANSTATGLVSSIVVENSGDGYAEGEVVTATIAGAAGATVNVTLSQTASGAYGVNQATITSAGSSVLGTGKLAVTFSPPAAGGSTATGYAVIGTLSVAFDIAAADKLRLQEGDALVTQASDEIAVIFLDTSAFNVIVRDMTKPVAYSNFSPIVDVDAGPNDSRTHCSELRWSLPGVTPPQRADFVELWRTSADQSLVFYRCEAYGVPGANGVEIIGTDTLTDEELFDPDRPNYAAMPVVLPNGNVNAYRFGRPRKDMSSCVAFQDRLWYGVSTSGEDANTLYYSEFDEFESCPDVNDLPIQNNTKSTDSLTALVPFGSVLLAMQHSHTYAVSYNTEPSIDATIQMISHRGCLHQRCWDIHENVLYAVDETGIYSMTRGGEVEAISMPIRDYFNSELIDFSKREVFFLTVCQRTHVLRFFTIMKSQPADTPAFALCYDIYRKSWWTERFPNSYCSAVTGRPGATRINSSIFGAVDGNLYEFDGDKDHANQSITRCEVFDGGSGYRRAPAITCPSSKGVQLKGVISEGRLVDVIIQSGGWDAKWGVQLTDQRGFYLTGHDGKLIQCVEYAPIELDIEPPSDGGEQAVASAHFTVTTRLVRDVTVAAGESFVRINSQVANPINPSIAPYLETQDGNYIAAVGGALDGVPMQAEPPPVEVGMEAIGDFLPLNCFVSKIVGPDIYLAHPDGTAIKTLGGEVRTDTNNDGYAESSGTPTIVYFRKPFYTHVPFRVATGAMQLINEDNVPKGGDSLIDRSITLVYTPTETEKNVEIIEYFNDSSTPRANVMRRSRGGPGGFEHRQDSASTVLNMSRTASSLADATGVAKAMFASRVYTDSTGEDQHIQVELHGRPVAANGGDDLTPHRFVMHSMTIKGVVEDAE